MIKNFIDKLASNPTIFIWLRRILENNFKAQKKVIKNYFSQTSTDKILDIGCGTGEFSVFFDSKYYTGFDIEDDYIKYSRSHYPGKFVLGDATQLPFADNEFDKVVIIGVLHHLDDSTCVQIFQEMKRVLKASASIVIMEDIDSANDNILTKKLHELDKGNHIRKFDEYNNLLKPHFKVIKTFKIKSGLCPYQVFILKNIYG